MNEDKERRETVTDLGAKTVFRNRRLLAELFGYLTEEFSGMDADDIERCIVTDEHGIPVDFNTELFDPNTGSVRLDTIAEAVVPGTDDRVRIRFNLEMQARTDMNYRLTDRAQMYAAMMLATQNKESSGGDKAAFESAQRSYNSASLQMASYKKQGLTENALTQQHHMNLAMADMIKNSSPTTNKAGFESAKKDYENAVTHYNKYLELLGDQANANHFRGLADIYIEQMDGADEAGKLAALRKADQVYADMETKYTYAADYAAYQRALLHYQMNTDMKKGEAKPYYEKYISLVEPKADKTAGDQKKLATAYQYLAVHAIQNDRIAEAKEYAAKLLQYKPDDETAKQIMDIK